MFNWRAAFGCFSFVGTCICAFFSMEFFAMDEHNLGTAFLIVTMILVFITGGLVFA